MLWNFKCKAFKPHSELSAIRKRTEIRHNYNKQFYNQIQVITKSKILKLAGNQRNRESFTDRNKYMKSDRFLHIFEKYRITKRKKKEIILVKERSPNRSKRANNNVTTMFCINHILYLGSTCSCILQSIPSSPGQVAHLVPSSSWYSRFKV